MEEGCKTSALSSPVTTLKETGMGRERTDNPLATEGGHMPGEDWKGSELRSHTAFIQTKPLLLLPRRAQFALA